MNANLEATLYYTLSTIAQTLAAAIGLLGAIVLFSLQATSRSVERAAKRLSEVPHEHLSVLYIRHLFTRRSYHELAARYGDLLTRRAETSSDLLVYHSTLMWELQHDTAIRRAFWKALLASAVAVVYAVTSLALTPQLAATPSAGYIDLAVAVVGTIGCLVLFGILLRVVMRSTPEDR